MARGATMAVQADTIPRMRKDDFDRRSDELKARMLAARNEAQKKPRSAGARESAPTGEAVRQSRKRCWRDQL